MRAESVNEICCAVKRVDNPVKGFDFFFCAFFGDEACFGNDFRKFFNEQFFRGFVNVRDKIVFAFDFDF